MLREGDAVLVKGSRFMGLDRLVTALTGTTQEGTH
jgi:UDP-N-acetylmuramyl pentapeptide synthase